MGGAGATTPLNLVGPTFLAQPRAEGSAYVYGANVYRWPDGGGEAVVYSDHRTFPGRDRLSRGYHARREGPSPARSIREAARRARTRVRRLARCGGYRYFWTLTFPDAVGDRRTADKRLVEFMHGGTSHRGAGPFGGRYIAVAELHPGGHGWHWHILTNREVRVEGVRAAWAAVLGRRGRVHVKVFRESRSAASYAAKYVSKAIEGGGLDGRHRYRVGDRVESPPVVYGLVLGRDVYEAAYRAVPDDAPAEVRVVRCATDGGPPAAWAGW